MSLHQGGKTAPTEWKHGYCSDRLKGLEQPIGVIPLTEGLQHQFHLIRQPDKHQHELTKSKGVAYPANTSATEAQRWPNHSWDFKRYSPARRQIDLQPSSSNILDNPFLFQTFTMFDIISSGIFFCYVIFYLWLCPSFQQKYLFT